MFIYSGARPLRYTKAALSGLFLLLSFQSVSSDSSPPPSSPLAAVQLGTLDEPRASGANSPLRYFACLAHDQRVYFNNEHYRTRFYRFTINSPLAFLEIKMIEAPDATLWFHLLDSNLGFLQEFRGGDDQLVETNLGRGTYYLQLLTDSSQRRNPDGSNWGQITFRARPVNFNGPDLDPAFIGNVGPNPITSQGVLSRMAGREFPYAFPMPAPPPVLPQGLISCPVAPLPEVDDIFDQYVGQAPRGRIYAGLTINLQLGAPTLMPVGLYRWDNSQLGTGWVAIVGGAFDHPGGEVRIATGYPGISMFLEDVYADYTLAVSAGASQPTPAPPAPGQPKVSPLGDPPRAPCIKIGSQEFGSC